MQSGSATAIHLDGSQAESLSDLLHDRDFAAKIVTGQSNGYLTDDLANEESIRDPRTDRRCILLGILLLQDHVGYCP